MIVSSLGRHGDTAMWVVLALVPGPRTAVGLLDAPTGRRGLSEYRLGRRLLSDTPATPTITTTTEEPTA